MAIFAQIKFSQETTVGTAGVAFVGTVGSTATTLHDPDENPSDPVGSWSIELLYAPPGSSYEFAVPLELGAADTDTPTADFVPDVSGSYRIRLRCWPTAGQVGPVSIDIRDFIVPEPKHGFVVPPYQQDPLPLPTIASGSATARANELNVDSQELGWTGRGNDGLLGTIIKKLDASNFDIVPDPTVTGAVLVSGGGVADFNYPTDSVIHGDSVWFVNTGAGNELNGLLGTGISRVSRASLKITERLRLPAPSPVSLAAYAVSSGDRLWLVSMESDLSTYVSMLLRQVIVAAPGSTTFGPPITLFYEANIDTPIPTGIVYDSINFKLWVSFSRNTSDGGVIGIPLNTLTPEAPVLLTPSSPLAGPLVFDSDVSHYGDGQPRLFVGRPLLGLITLVNNLNSAATLESSFVVPADKGYALAIGGGAAGTGGGRIYVGGMNAGGINSYTTSGTLLAGPIATSLVYSLTYEPANDSIIGAGQVGNHIELASYDAATITTLLAGPTALPTTDETAGPGFGMPFRYGIGAGKIWAFSPSTDSFPGATDPVGHAFQLNSLTLDAIVPLVTPGASSFQFPDHIIWRLDGTGDVQTWTEVMTVIGQRRTPVTIVLDQPGTYPIPPGSPGPLVIYDMKQARFEAKAGPHDQIMVQIQRFAILHDLAGISGGMRLQHNHFTADATGSALTFPPAITPVFKVERGAAILGLVNAEEPIIKLLNGANPEFYLVFNELGTAHFLGGTPAIGTVYVEAGALLNVIATTGGLGIDAPQDPGWIASDVGGTINWIHDGSMYLAGNFWNGIHPNNLGTNINQALGQIGGSGPTGFEPIYQGGGPPSVGCVYWNVSLSTLYIWNGVVWVALGGGGGVPGFENAPNFNVGAGATALDSLTVGVGIRNTAIGTDAATAVTTGSQNVAVGASALAALTTGTLCTAIGDHAMPVTTGSYNTAVGSSSLLNNTAGQFNTAIGNGALATATTSDKNTAIGYAALNAATGAEDVAVGANAMRAGPSGGQNAAVGVQALENTASFGCVAIGYKAANAVTSGYLNVAVGWSALLVCGTGGSNTALGGQALQSCTNGNSNTGVGYLSLENVVGGSNNTALGNASGSGITSGSFNTAIGKSSLSGTVTGDENIAIGHDAGATLTSGNNNILIGDDVPTGATSDYLGIGNGTITGDLSAKQITFRRTTTAGITASTTQTQGQGPLTSDINQISTVANPSDTVTLPTAVAGRQILVINGGANKLKVFPASGDDLGAGVNIADFQLVGVTTQYTAYDATNWIRSDLIAGGVRASASPNFGTINAGVTKTITVTVTGLESSMGVVVSPNADLPQGIAFQGARTGTDSLTIQLQNVTDGAGSTASNILVGTITFDVFAATSKFPVTP